MLHTDYLFDDESIDDGFSDALLPDAQWNDDALDADEFLISLQHLPTEQELLAMESGKDAVSLEGALYKVERRTAVRH